MKRVTGLIIALIAGALLFYTSRFWIFSLWDRPGLFGSASLPPQGGLVQRWLRGTDLAPFELLLWAICAFLMLTILQNLFDRFWKKN
ncbi:MAG: hypothetical protein AAF217_09040 [Pseudomonadota bacterium]